MKVQAIGIDLGKIVFHLVGLNRSGEVVVQKKFSRAQLLADGHAAVQFGQADDITVVTIERREAEGLFLEVVATDQKLQM